MMHNNQDNHPRHRLMFTAGATTLAATGAVFGATVLNQNQTASADQVQGQAQSQVDQHSQWQARSRTKYSWLCDTVGGHLGCDCPGL
ncbi:unnamed protein product [Fructobacillus cardui]|uniref:Uncharacterized protein n=1 Tax=Fructobacillus cardui TaxID=2893170 RepID=A0ABN9YUM4_9LACO|nr:unnamed protein product [Fructobacillus cardui]